MKVSRSGLYVVLSKDNLQSYLFADFDTAVPRSPTEISLSFTTPLAVDMVGYTAMYYTVASIGVSDRITLK